MHLCCQKYDTEGRRGKIRENKVKKCNRMTECQPRYRRPLSEAKEEEEAMSSSTRTSQTTMTFSEVLQPRDVLRNLNQQRSDVATCDVIVRSSTPLTSPIHAHRCILAAASDYFRGLFRFDMTGAKVIEAVIPGSSRVVIDCAITFMYTGVIDISEETVGEIVQLADYLGIPKILKLCEKFMRQNLNDDNCLKLKVMSELYPLGTLSNSIQNYILPRMSTLIRRSDTVNLPVEVLRQLLSDNKTNYVRDEDTLTLVQNLITNRAEMNPAEKEKARDLLDCVDFKNLPSMVIVRHVLSNTDTLDWLRARPQLLWKVLDIVVERNMKHRSDVVEAILCKAPRMRDDLQVMLYLVNDDTWRILRQPRKDENESVNLWPGLEAVVIHDGFLYALSSRMERTIRYPYWEEKKCFNRLNLKTGAWFVLPSPLFVTGQTVLVSSLPDCLWAIDRTGRVERYVIADQRWMGYCCTKFPVYSYGTTHLLPMPNGGELYLLRNFSAGRDRSRIPRRRLSIYRLDAGRDSDSYGHSWFEPSQVELASLFDADGKEFIFSGYSIASGLISLKDELGHIRVQYDMAQAKWTTLPMGVTRPGFVRCIYGSMECYPSRVYFVTSSESGKDIFAMFDTKSGRFKMTQQPPYTISDIMGHVMLPKSYVESAFRED